MCIRDSSSIRLIPVNARQMLYVRVTNQHIGITPALRAARKVPAPGVRKPSFVPVNVHQRAHNGSFTLCGDQREQRARGAKGIPDRVEIVVVRLIRLPKRILSCPINGHQHRVVERCVEHLFLLRSRARELDRTQRLVPRRNRIGVNTVKVESGNFAAKVSSGLLYACLLYTSAPRFGLVYAPDFREGLLGKILGSPGKFSIRAGYGIAYQLSLIHI